MKYLFKTSIHGHRSLESDSESKTPTLFSLRFSCEMDITPCVGMTFIFKQDEDIEVESELFEYLDHTGVFTVESFHCLVPDGHIVVDLSNADVEEEYEFEDALKICKLYKILYGFDFHY